MAAIALNYRVGTSLLLSLASEAFLELSWIETTWSCWRTAAQGPIRPTHYGRGLKSACAADDARRGPSRDIQGVRRQPEANLHLHVHGKLLLPVCIPRRCENLLNSHRDSGHVLPETEVVDPHSWTAVRLPRRQANIRVEKALSSLRESFRDA